MILYKVIFIGKHYSGHEKMAEKILLKLNNNINIFSQFELNSLNSIYYKNIFSLVLKINIGSKILLVNGSPYGALFEKIIFKIMKCKVIEYTPFPELEEMMDKPHHKIMKIVNNICVNKRILIEDWQIKFSAVKNVFILKNII